MPELWRDIVVISLSISTGVFALGCGLLVMLHISYRKRVVAWKNDLMIGVLDLKQINSFVEKRAREKV